MVAIVEQDWWFLLDNVILLGANVPNADYINLAWEQWEDMLYDKVPYTFIDYLGEYDMHSIFIYAYASKDKKMSYLIQNKNQTVAIIQDKKALDEDEMDAATVFLYTHDSISDKIDKRELEWEKIKLGANLNLSA